MLISNGNILKPHASATSPEANRRKYGAKELTTDHGLNLYDFAARFQNPAFPHFTTPDPLATDYYPTSPYVYCGADPINLIDPTGMKINMIPLVWVDDALRTNTVGEIINDLIMITGLNIFISNGFLDYEKDDKGDPVINVTEVNGEMKEAGSPTARKELTDAISSQNVIETAFTDKGCKGDDNLIAICPAQIDEFIENANEVDGKTMGYGMSFLHEMLHNKGPEYTDTTADVGTGIVVDTMNQIRSELNNKGYNFGFRINYKALPINSEIQIIPFDQSSFNASRIGLQPANDSKYIRTLIRTSFK